VTKGYLSWSRLSSKIDWDFPTAIEHPTAAVSKLVDHLLILILLSLPLFITISLALFLIRQTPPRPPRRRLATQPGTVASRATFVAFLFVGTFYATVQAGSQRSERAVGADVAFALLCLPIFVGLSIVSAWVAQITAGLWRPEPDRIDCLGRFVAAAWIAFGLYNAYHYLVFGFQMNVGLMFFIF
jgi:hypothetical protein